MAVKIKLSYEDEAELKSILKLLGNTVLSWKRPKRQQGRYRRAYIILRQNLKKPEVK